MIQVAYTEAKIERSLGSLLRNDHRMLTYDQAYTLKTLERKMHRGDFHKIPKTKAAQEAYRQACVNDALKIADDTYKKNNPIKTFRIKRKTAYSLNSVPAELVMRKTVSNLSRKMGGKTASRQKITSVLKYFLQEGVPYRIYRLDIKSFYESFDLNEIVNLISRANRLNPQSKQIIRNFIDHFISHGGTGVPRGISISAVLSNILMAKFDSYVRKRPEVYFYGRYVDDIVILTNLDENQDAFFQNLEAELPSGLRFHKTSSKYSIQEIKPGQKAESPDKPLLSLEYLGYQYSVFGKKNPNMSGRLVTVDIANKKVSKIKTRIISTFLDFSKTGNDLLFQQRIQYLTSNFYIVDKRTHKKQLSGIYYSYPLVDSTSVSLAGLDKFLRNAALSKKGRVFTITSPAINNKLRRSVLSRSFKSGHENRSFRYFSLPMIGAIQACWKYK